jgi:hypothetical protein
MPAHASHGISVDVFSCATSLHCIERLRPEWDELYRNCASPHLGLTFNTHAVNIFFRRETEDWWLFVARGDVGLVGAVFGYTDVLPVGRLRLPIFHAGIEHVSDPVLRKGLETVAATAILEAIYRTLPRCVLVQFDSLRIDASEVLCSSASHTHHLIRTESAPPVYWFDVTGHEKKELGKGRNLKRNLRRAQAKLDRDHGFSFEFRCTRDRDVNRDQCEQFFRLEAAGWKGRNGGAIGCSQWQSSGNPPFFHRRQK